MEVEIAVRRSLLDTKMYNDLIIIFIIIYPVFLIKSFSVENMASMTAR